MVYGSHSRYCLWIMHTVGYVWVSSMAGRCLQRSAVGLSPPQSMQAVLRNKAYRISQRVALEVCNRVTAWSLVSGRVERLFYQSKLSLRRASSGILNQRKKLPFGKSRRQAYLSSSKPGRDGPPLSPMGYSGAIDPHDDAGG